MNLKVLKFLRKIGLTPFILMLAISFLFSWVGIDFFGLQCSGPMVFFVLIIGFAENYYWVGIISLIIVIVTTVLIRKQNVKVSSLADVHGVGGKDERNQNPKGAP